jgi:hypothetical protein
MSVLDVARIRGLPLVGNERFEQHQPARTENNRHSSAHPCKMCSFKTAATMISRRKAAGYGRNQTPKNWRTKGTQFWKLQKEQNSKAGTVLDKLLFRIWYLCWNLTMIVKPVFGNPNCACRLPLRFSCSCVQDNMVRKIRAQKLSRHEYCHTANPRCPGMFGKIGKPVTVPGNEIIRSIDLEQFCGLRFLFG